THIPHLLYPASPLQLTHSPLFFFHAPPPTEIYTLSLHDALPIFSCAYTQGKREQFSGFNRTLDAINNVFRKFSAFHDETGRLKPDRKSGSAGMPRPISYAVFCLKKKKSEGTSAVAKSGCMWSSPS